MIEQLNATIGIAASMKAASLAGTLSVPATINQVIILLGVICGLAYFYFSKEHRGWFGGAATIGIWVLMVGFGASFGYTVMARISLFIDRVQFLGRWLSCLFS